MNFVDSRNSNAVKGAVHGALLSLATLCAVYNATAWRARKESHLARNAWVYSALVVFEGYQISQHCERQAP